VRKPLRFALNALAAAGIQVERVHQAGRHTEIHLAGGGLVRLHRGNKMSRGFERGLRETIRRWGSL
jgi:hypothetical protein